VTGPSSLVVGRGPRGARNGLPAALPCGDPGPPAAAPHGPAVPPGHGQCLRPRRTVKRAPLRPTSGLGTLLTNHARAPARRHRPPGAGDGHQPEPRRRPQPCPALPCPALPCPAQPCPAQPCPALPSPALPSQVRQSRCELLTLTNAKLAGYRQCGRRGTPSVADGRIYRVACPQHRAEVARVRAAGLGERLRWADPEEVRP